MQIVQTTLEKALALAYCNQQTQVQPIYYRNKYLQGLVTHEWRLKDYDYLSWYYDRTEIGPKAKTMFLPFDTS